jgi:hypothetical protein
VKCPGLTVVVVVRKSVATSRRLTALFDRPACILTVVMEIASSEASFRLDVSKLSERT